MNSLAPDSPSVQTYLQILQGVTTRMAANSASAKSWCIGLVSAIVVVSATKGRPEYVWVSVVPVVLFFALDTYYLGLERCFRNLYSDFVRKLHAGSATSKDVFVVNPGGTFAIVRAAVRATLSLSIWPFYLLLILMLVLVAVVLLNNPTGPLTTQCS